MSKQLPMAVESALHRNPGAIITENGVEMPSHLEGYKNELLVACRGLLDNEITGESPETFPLDTHSGNIEISPPELPPVDTEQKEEEKPEEQPSEEKPAVEIAVAQEVAKVEHKKPGPKSKAK